MSPKPKVELAVAERTHPNNPMRDSQKMFNVAIFIFMLWMSYPHWAEYFWQVCASLSLATSEFDVLSIVDCGLFFRQRTHGDSPRSIGRHRKRKYGNRQRSFSRSQRGYDSCRH